jgi:hypothetical protein
MTQLYEPPTIGGWSVARTGAVRARITAPSTAEAPVHRMIGFRSVPGVIMMMMAGALAPAAVPVAGDLIQTYNSRALGSPGVRRIRLDLQSGALTTRSFEVVHAWQQTPQEISSLVLLDAPLDLRGTSYLWSEDNRLPTGLSIFLRLPAGKRLVLAIEPGQFDEGLLGSDFSYVDLLWQIPMKGRQFRLIGERQVAHASVWAIECRPETSAARDTSAWDRIEYYLSRESNLLMGADYFEHPPASGSPAPAAKRLRVSGWTARDGVWAPTTMVMSREGDQRSVLTLLSARYRIKTLRTGLFLPAALGPIAGQLESGTPADAVLEVAK